MPSTEDRSFTRRPRLLYVGEFPPSNHHGGAILLKRLLDQHPTDGLTVIASRAGMTASQATGLIDCVHIVVPAFRGNLKHVGKLMELVFVALKTIVEVRQTRVEALITIVQGRYFLAASLAAWVTATPHVTLVYDNFLSSSIGPSGLVRISKRSLTRKILRNAAHIYTVSPQMQRLVSQECGVESEVQLPSTTAPDRRADSQIQIKRGSGPVILFAGQIGYTVKDCLDLLVQLITSGQLNRHGLAGIQLHLYTTMTNADIRAFGWEHEDIVSRGWIPQSELSSVLADADILFLPYSFSKGARDAVETAFPSKTADYLAAGKPLLVFGPAYSSLVRYASELGFAEVVNEFSPAALAKSIEKIALSHSYREQLVATAREVFAANHDIQRQQRRFYLLLDGIAGARCNTTNKSHCN